MAFRVVHGRGVPPDPERPSPPWRPYGYGAARCGEGDLAKRLPVANPKDEIGRLTITINGLLARLEAAFRRLEETLSRQRRFAADASHELRTP